MFRLSSAINPKDSLLVLMTACGVFFSQGLHRLGVSLIEEVANFTLSIIFDLQFNFLL